MEKTTCKNCKHYHQHYVKSGKQFHTPLCGHCSHPRIKHRDQHTPACAHYKEQPAPEQKK